ncbi:hypothetical protein Agub_g9709, partial [Astrephomene gubernaculifera]
IQVVEEDVRTTEDDEGDTVRNEEEVESASLASLASDVSLTPPPSPFVVETPELPFSSSGNGGNGLGCYFMGQSPHKDEPHALAATGTARPASCPLVAPLLVLKERHTRGLCCSGPYSARFARSTGVLGQSPSPSPPSHSAKGFRSARSTGDGDGGAADCSTACMGSSLTGLAPTLSPGTSFHGAHAYFANRPSRATAGGCLETAASHPSSGGPACQNGSLHAPCGAGQEPRLPPRPPSPQCRVGSGRAGAVAAAADIRRRAWGASPASSPRQSCSNRSICNSPQPPPSPPSRAMSDNNHPNVLSPDLCVQGSRAASFNRGRFLYEVRHSLTAHDGAAGQVSTQGSLPTRGSHGSATTPRLKEEGANGMSQSWLISSPSSSRPATPQRQQPSRPSTPQRQQPSRPCTPQRQQPSRPNTPQRVQHGLQGGSLVVKPSPPASVSGSDCGFHRSSAASELLAASGSSEPRGGSEAHATTQKQGAAAHKEVMVAGIYGRLMRNCLATSLRGSGQPESQAAVRAKAIEVAASTTFGGISPRRLRVGKA